ncbi:MAG: hypothetical protein HOZ81_11555 [Streptomyces sp.]|nr:hypothetical protein [Streptomyces sp.]
MTRSPHRTIKIDSDTPKYKECSWNGKRNVAGTPNDTKLNVPSTPGL